MWREAVGEVLRRPLSIPPVPWNVTVCSSAPLLVQVTELYVLTCTLPGEKAYSPASDAPMPTVPVSTAVPPGPSMTVCGGLGAVGHGCGPPVNLQAHRPSPLVT